MNNMKSFYKKSIYVTCITFTLFLFVVVRYSVNVNLFERYETFVPQHRHEYLDGRPLPGNEMHTNYDDKKIILWYVQPRYVNATPGLAPLKLCPERNCFMTTNLSYMQSSDAVMFNAQIIQLPKPPPRSRTDQVWILHNTEPQKADWSHSSSFRNPYWRDLFNWTMFYREDSDIFAPYGIVRKKTPSESLKRDLRNVVAGKTKTTAAMISHCGTEGKRMEYVKLLQKHMNIDIYGGCGTLGWPRSKDKEFLAMVNTTYKFYLAFENSFCDDYISEKFLRYYNTDTVLVARGGANYNKFVPPGSFVNAADFKTVKELADHIKYLDGNKEAYLKILHKKEPYISITEPQETVQNNVVIFTHYQYETVAFCEICYRLRHLEIYSKTINRVDQWFDEKLCHAPNDLV